MICELQARFAFFLGGRRSVARLCKLAAEVSSSPLTDPAFLQESVVVAFLFACSDE